MTTETQSEYKIEGYGSSIKDALKEADEKETGLVKKLKDAKVSEKFNSRTIYQVKYIGKQDKLDSLICPEFTLRVKDPDALQEEAKKRANGGSLKSYNLHVTVERYLQFDQTQLALVRGGSSGYARPPTAEADNNPRSYLTNFLR